MRAVFAVLLASCLAIVVKSFSPDSFTPWKIHSNSGDIEANYRNNQFNREGDHEDDHSVVEIFNASKAQKIYLRPQGDKSFSEWSPPHPSAASNYVSGRDGYMGGHREELIKTNYEDRISGMIERMEKKANISLDDQIKRHLNKLLKV